jgi:tetratricopeptide (TPR) repeat protein
LKGWKAYSTFIIGRQGAVKQQSEHLSNAQIEQYGKRASGAGPETEAWVDQHLDDCSSCRSRVLDFQRTRFALLPDPKVNKVSTSDCSSEDDLRNLAAGLHPDPKAAELKAHASTCGRCGPLLQEYIEDFSDKSSPEEQAFLDQLRTSSPEFREQKAREMLKQEASPNNRVIPGSVPTDWRRLFSWKWMMVPALPAVALLAVGIWYLQRDTPEKVAKLLAQAQTEQRTTEMRWPGAEWSRVSVKQAPMSALHTSTNLLDAENILERQHADSSSTESWLEMSARVDIFNRKPKLAIDKLTKLFSADPDSAALKSDLAMAYFESGEITGSPADYKQSLTYLTDLVRQRPLDREALYNRAVVIERLELTQDAIQAWNDYLRIETEPQWISDARGHLARLQMQK